jgi:hypothetical protein
MQQQDGAAQGVDRSVQLLVCCLHKALLQGVLQCCYCCVIHVAFAGVARYSKAQLNRLFVYNACRTVKNEVTACEQLNDV